MKKLLFGVFLSVVACLSFGAVNAASVTVEVPTVAISAPSGKSITYYASLESLDDSPMQTNNKKMTISFKGAGEGSFGTITYTKPGLYKYKIYQEKMTSNKIKYDKTVYDYLVQINIEEGGVLEASTALKKTSGEDKYTVALFTNLSKYHDKDNNKATPNPNPRNPFTGDKIVKYFVVSVIAIILILIIIIYVKNSKEDD